MLSSLFLLSNFVEKDPGIIIGPISKLLGFVINIVFNFVHMLTTNHSLGISIILFTLLVRFALLPLNYKQQKSMYIMQKIQPEMKKIQDKYKNSKDPEAPRKMQMEMSKLYQKHNCNPFGGCLPLLLQLPILFALFYIMKNPYIYISKINDIYVQIATAIQETNGYIDVISPIASSMTPPKLDGVFNITVLADLQKYLSKFSPEQWVQIQEALPSLNIGELLAQKNNIETFLGINLVETVGLKFPNIIIVILSGATTFLSGFIISKSSKSTDPNVKMQQKIMNIIMPIPILLFTINVPAGVGIYWIAGNIVQIFNHIILTKYCEKKFKDLVI